PDGGRRRGRRAGRGAVPDPASPRGRRVLPPQGERSRPLDPGHAPAPGAVRGGAMSVLVLVRHGQASFSADDYDDLSPAGQAQARRLGDYWTHQAQSFDEIYVGPRRRQQQTAALVGDRFRAAGRPWPEPVVLEELDEYDLDGLLGRLAPALARQDHEFA